VVEEILPNLYRIEIPLPESALKSLNAYVIRSSERNLIIDTGMDRKECMDAMQIGLKELGLNLKRTDFFITHFHVDHLGLVSSLVTNSSKIYFNKPDADRLESGPYWDELIHFAYLNGFPQEELEGVLSNHQAINTDPKRVDVSNRQGGRQTQRRDYELCASKHLAHQPYMPLRIS
jgi:glyoxylase-like metal-dependent hydrolase (beta-lactamase superfamily II)